jgi:hypothetical protein
MKATKDGSRQITCFFFPGDCRPADAAPHEGDSDLTALTACRLAALAHADLMTLTRSHSGIAEALWKYTACCKLHLSGVGRKRGR